MMDELTERLEPESAKHSEDEESGDHEPFWSELDWDDMVESFVGALAANLFIMLVLVLLASRGRRRFMRR